jgi:hypothetical protein
MGLAAWIIVLCGSCFSGFVEAIFRKRFAEWRKKLEIQITKKIIIKVRSTSLRVSKNSIFVIRRVELSFSQQENETNYWRVGLYCVGDVHFDEKGSAEANLAFLSFTEVTHLSEFGMKI